MIRERMERWLDKHPKKKEPGTWHPAKRPWQLAVTILDAHGEKDFIDIIDYDEDYFRDDWGGWEHWEWAKWQAQDEAREILKKGYTVDDDPAKDYYPLHRIHLVQTYPKPEEEIRAEIKAKAQAVIDDLEGMKDANTNL